MKSLPLTAVAAATCTALTIAPSPARAVSSKVASTNLPTNSNIQLYTSDFRTSTVKTVKGHTIGKTTVCQGKYWAAFRPTAEYSRAFKLTSRYGGASASAKASVASFSTHSAAVAAANAMNKSFNCVGYSRSVRGLDHQWTRAKTRTVLISGQRVQLYYLYMAPHNGGYVLEEDSAVFARGNHVELVTLRYGTQNDDPRWIIKTAAASLKRL